MNTSGDATSKSWHRNWKRSETVELGGSMLDVSKFGAQMRIQSKLQERCIQTSANSAAVATSR
eukprot:6995767-Karenia_brevis.AAC.1